MVRAELCGTAAERKKKVNSVQIFLVLYKKMKKVHERPKRCLVLCCKFIASEYCETLQASLNRGETSRFSFIFPTQLSGVGVRVGGG